MSGLAFIEGYPEYMYESIRKVEKTRDKRIGKLVPQMSQKQREEILSQYHPDYTEGGKRKIRHGKNKGDLALFHCQPKR